MELVIRDVRIRGNIEYIIDDNGMPAKSQLNLLIQACYNSILTNPDVIEKNPEIYDNIVDLRAAVEKYLGVKSQIAEN